VVFLAGFFFYRIEKVEDFVSEVDDGANGRRDGDEHGRDDENHAEQFIHIDPSILISIFRHGFSLHEKRRNNNTNFSFA
jgi:hypothetical protein